MHTRLCVSAHVHTYRHKLLICTHMQSPHPEDRSPAFLHGLLRSPLLIHHLSYFSSPPPSLQLLQFSVVSVSLISTSSPPRRSTPHLPPLSAAAILVLGGGHGHASLSGLINHPRSWQLGLHQGPMACFFLPQKTRILSSSFSLAVVPHDQG